MFKISLKLFIGQCISRPTEGILLNDLTMEYHCTDVFLLEIDLSFSIYRLKYPHKV